MGFFDRGRSLDLGSLATAAFGQDLEHAWSDGDTKYNAEGKIVPKIAIPKGDGPERQAWDANYRLAIQEIFPGPLTPVMASTDPDKTINRNPIRNRERYAMYQRMIRAGERLPPIVVRQEGPNRYYVLDGNHRWFAAQAAGVPEVEALLVGGGLSAFGGLRYR